MGRPSRYLEVVRRRRLAEVLIRLLYDRSTSGAEIGGRFGGNKR